MALMNSYRSVWLILLTLVGQSTICAGSLHRLWELDLRKIIQGAPSDGAGILPVQIIRFSPDGRQLAVVVDGDPSAAVFRNRLLVVATQDPERSPAQFEISGEVGYEGVSTPFGWLSYGKKLFAAGKVIDLGLRTGCELPRATDPPSWPSFPIGTDRLIQGGADLPDATTVRAYSDAMDKAMKDRKGPLPASSLPPLPPEPRSHFRLFDSACVPQGEWEVPEAWQIADVAVERHIAAVTRKIGFNAYEFLIVDPFARKVIRRWPGNYPFVGKFAEGGRVLCNVAEDGDKAWVVCRDVDTGEKIGESRGLSGGSPVASAALSSRIVASGSHLERDPLSSYESDSVIDRMVVWDYRSGEQLASWRPEWQSQTNTLNGQVRKPYQFAISPDGRYIAEGGNGVVRLFKIEP
jgi:WD40 repeat protein